MCGIKGIGVKTSYILWKYKLSRNKEIHKKLLSHIRI